MSIAQWEGLTFKPYRQHSCERRLGLARAAKNLLNAREFLRGPGGTSAGAAVLGG